MNYKGWAVFCDCDFLWLEDISKLFSLKDDNFAVMCCKHDYKPLNDLKMDGKTVTLSEKKLVFISFMELFSSIKFKIRFKYG